MRFALLNLAYSLGLLIGMLFMVEVGRAHRLVADVHGQRGVRALVSERSRVHSLRYWDC